MSTTHFLFPLLLVSSLAACAAPEYEGSNGDRADEFAEADGGLVEDDDSEDDEIPENDGFALARDVDLAHLIFEETVVAPEFYSVPEQDTEMNLGGTEFWQRWPDGEMPTFSYSIGTDVGRRCMYASAIRFSTIMANPPQEILDVLETSNWGGSFFNWNDDYSGGEQTGSGARLWAWRTGLIKWISQTDADGSCHLPTQEMLVEAATDCLDTAARDEGEIQGCSAR